MSNEKLSVPYIVYEGELARQERHIKRLLVILAIMLALFTISNLAWLYVWNQYEYIDESETTTTTTIDAQQDGEGVNIVGGEDVNYGSESDDTNDEKEKDTSKTEEEKR